MRRKRAFIILHSSEMKGGIEEFNQDLCEILARNNIECKKMYLHDNVTNLFQYKLGKKLPFFIKYCVIKFWLLRQNYIFINQPGHVKYFKFHFSSVKPFLIVHNPSEINKFDILYLYPQLRLICVAQHIMEYLGRFDNIKYLITPPLRTSLIEHINFRLNVAPSFLYAGRVSGEKNIGQLDHLSMYFNQKFKTKIDVYSDENKNLKNYSNLVFHPWLTRENLQEKYFKYSFYVNLSTIEGMPISVREAMLSGCIPILSDIPAHREIVEHKVDGYLLAVDFNTNDLNDLIDFINLVLSDFMSFSKMCIKKVADHNVDNLEKQLIPLLK